MKYQSQRGFTLTELMTVVAIVAILASMATVMVRDRTSAVDVGHQFRALVDEASRQAVRAGTVRANVATALGTRARTQVVASDDGKAFYVQRLVEDPAPAITATWETIDSFSLPRWITAAGHASQVGTYTAVTPATDWTTFALRCFPDGTCERKSVFFESSEGSTSSRQSRVAVLPVASPQVISKWN